MRGAKRLLHDRDGAAALEFAIIAPMMFAVLLGILSYGGYFWTSHSLQQIANDSARAAIAGLDAAERKSLAQAALTSEIPDYPFLDSAKASLDVVDGATSVTVNLVYDAAGSPFFAVAGFVPMPSPQISRQAVVKLGGY